MLKASDLRIGNWVKNLYTGNEVELNPLMLYEFDDYIQPIPLTEEWLLKFGFEKQQDGDYTLGYPSLDKCYAFSEQWLHNDYPTAACNALAECEYVHQLQNLYHSLTGEELTIKQ